MKKTPVLSMLLYVTAALLAVYAVWTFFYCFDYVSQLTASGQLNYQGYVYDVFNLYMSSCMQYIIYALVLGAQGRILQLAQHRRATAETDSVDFHQDSGDAGNA